MSGLPTGDSPQEESVPEIPPLKPQSARPRGVSPTVKLWSPLGYWPAVLTMATRWQGRPGSSGRSGQRKTKGGHSIFPSGRQPRPSHPPPAPGEAGCPWPAVVAEGEVQAVVRVWSKAWLAVLTRGVLLED